MPGYVAAQVGPLSFKEGVVLPDGERWLTSARTASHRGRERSRRVQDATYFGQWFNDDNDLSIKSQGVLELSPFAGATNRFRFSSPPHAVLGGFFPVDPPWDTGAARNSPLGAVSRASLLCNLWPYWFPRPWGPLCMGDQYLFPPSVDATTPGA